MFVRSDTAVLGPRFRLGVIGKTEFSDPDDGGISKR
jgi:hypothetical protein